MQTLGVITTPSKPAPGQPSWLSPLLGVPLVLWAVNNLRRAMPSEAIVIIADDEPTLALAARHGVTAASSTAPLDAEHILIHDPMRPFCSLKTVRAGIEQNARELEAVRHRSIETLRIQSREDLELARAVARGLAPDHPCVVGVRRLRLPLSADIHAVVSDVDGVLTDGRIHIDSNGAHARSFHMHDGMGTRRLQHAGIEIGWLSAGADDGTIRARADRLGVHAVDVGEGDKGERFVRLCARMKAAPMRTLYIGDDVNDLPAMELAGLTACPRDARPEVRAAADLILDAAGGAGAFRELADLLLDDAAMKGQSLASRTEETKP